MADSLRIDRRRLVKLGLSAGVLASMPCSTIAFSQSDTDRLLHFVSESDAPTRPKETGVLSNREFGKLFSLCQYVDETWEFGSNLSMYRSTLQTDLELKTGRQPSYLSEYRSAIELIDIVSNSSVSAEFVWPTLLFSETDVENIEATKLGRARRFTFGEIVAHQIPIAAAFRSFGLINYRAFFGGPYHSAASYRRAGT